MSFKVIPQGSDRYGLWSTWADGFVLEDATRAELREWADDAPPDASVPDVDELVEAAEDRRSRAGLRSYEQSPDYVSDE